MKPAPILTISTSESNSSSNLGFIRPFLKNGVYFSTTELRQLGTKKQDLMEEYDKHQRQIVVQAMQVSATFVPVLERASVLVAELDVLASLAYVAAYSPTPYVRPEMTDGEEDGLGIEVRGKKGHYLVCNYVNHLDLFP